MANYKENKWRDDEKQFIRDNWGLMPLATLCEKLGRTAQSVKQYALRNKLPKHQGKNVNNILLSLLRTRFRHLEDFSPSSYFYSETGLSSHRYSDLYNGRSQIKPDEYRAVAKYFNITAVEAFDSRQLELFTSENK